MERYPDLVDTMIHPTETTPIFGLAVSLEEYCICSLCRKGYLNSESFRRHLCAREDSQASGTGSKTYFRSLVQTFFHGTRLCYFPIDKPIANASGVAQSDFDLFKSQCREMDTSEDRVEEPDDYRELSQFLIKEGWISHLSNCSKSELADLTMLPKDDHYLAPIRWEIHRLMSNIQRVIGDAGFHVRRLLGKRPS